MASVSKRKWKKPDGSTGEAWAVRYLVGGKHKQKTFARMKDANAFRAKVEVEAAARVHTGIVQDCTVAQAAAQYGRHNDRRLADGQIKRGSHKNLAGLLSNSIVPHLGRLRMADVDPLVLENWFTALRDDDGLSARTALERLIGFSSFWKFAKRRKMVGGENPASIALDEIGRIPKPRIRTLTAQEVKTLLSTAETRRKWQSEHSWAATRLAVNLAAFSGLRIGEILALRLCDVEIEGRRVHVRHTLNEWDELTTPKTRDSRRVVPIAQHVADLFAEYVTTHYIANERQIIIRTGFGRKHAAGGAVSSSQFGVHYWRPLVVEAGLQVEGDLLHFHALRHFAASWWLSNRMPIAEASRLLGHSNPTITLGIYSHVVMEIEDRDSAMDTMSAALLHATLGQELRILRTAEKTLEYQPH